MHWALCTSLQLQTADIQDEVSLRYVADVGCTPETARKVYGDSLPSHARYWAQTVRLLRGHGRQQSLQSRHRPTKPGRSQSVDLRQPQIGHKQSQGMLEPLLVDKQYTALRF